jgi:hypothetical protein|tara:strand:+ start:456 stop:656 length:201 start_codon:yes stop_codon:yes gene_type:complete
MRIITIILTELASDKIKSEEKLQRLINSNGDLDQNIIDIKNQLREVVLIDQMINKWNDYTSEVKKP